MEGRHKEFNQYLATCGSINVLTKAFAKLFEMTDDERPENATWFVMQHMSPENKGPPIVDIIEYEYVLKELKKVKDEIENAGKVDINAKSPGANNQSQGPNNQPQNPNNPQQDPNNPPQDPNNQPQDPNNPQQDPNNPPQDPNNQP